MVSKCWEQLKRIDTDEKAMLDDQRWFTVVRHSTGRVLPHNTYPTFTIFPWQVSRSPSATNVIFSTSIEWVGHVCPT